MATTTTTASVTPSTGGPLYIDTQPDDMVHDAQLDYDGCKLATSSPGTTTWTTSNDNKGRKIKGWRGIDCPQCGNKSHKNNQTKMVEQGDTRQNARPRLHHAHERFIPWLSKPTKGGNPRRTTTPIWIRSNPEGLKWNRKGRPLQSKDWGQQTVHNNNMNRGGGQQTVRQQKSITDEWINNPSSSKP